MAGSQLFEKLFGGRLWLVGQYGRGCGRDVGAWVQGQQTEQVLRLWSVTVEGLVECGSQVAVPVVQPVQNAALRAEGCSVFGER
ncbi:hypothetical protein JCM13580A_62350 [Streptomyces drozdowiczii]|nr:hypothetical protein [Streptomyces sp. SID4920]MYX68595.1 hypothetical protein [Streptomyces sp. SID8373]